MPYANKEDRLAAQRRRRNAVREQSYPQCVLEEEERRKAALRGTQPRIEHDSATGSSSGGSNSGHLRPVLRIAHNFAASLGREKTLSLYRSITPAGPTTTDVRPTVDTLTVGTVSNEKINEPRAFRCVSEDKTESVAQNNATSVPNIQQATSHTNSTVNNDNAGDILYAVQLQRTEVWPKQEPGTAHDESSECTLELATRYSLLSTITAALSKMDSGNLASVWSFIQNGNME